MAVVIKKIRCDRANWPYSIHVHVFNDPPLNIYDSLGRIIILEEAEIYEGYILQGGWGPRMLVV
jgi:hypothetical protein